MSTLDKLRDDAHYYGEFGSQFLSNSDISALLKNPRDYKKKQEDNINFAKGKYFHQLILEPEKAEVWEFVDVSSRNTKAYKGFCEDRNLPFAMLTKEAEEIRWCVDTMMGNLDFYEEIRNPNNEYEVPAVGEIEGVMWKGKADIVHPDMLIDLKTTSNIDKFRRSAFDYNYDSQCYIYQELFQKPLVFYVVDKTTGMLGIFRPTEEFVRNGREKVVEAVKVWHKFFGPNATEDVNHYYYDKTL